MLALLQRLSLSVRERTEVLRCFPEPPRVRFAAEQSRCQVCDQPLKSYKTTEARTVVSWTHSTLRVVEQLRYCPQHRGAAAGNGAAGISRSQQLSALVPPRHRYAYDLIAHVGRRSFLDCRNERELQEELAAAPAGLSIPRRSLERLREEFLWYVATVHAQALPSLRQLFARNGGSSWSANSSPS